MAVYRFRRVWPCTIDHLRLHVGPSVNYRRVVQPGLVLELECDPESALDLVDFMEFHGYELMPLPWWLRFWCWVVPPTVVRTGA